MIDRPRWLRAQLEAFDRRLHLDNQPVIVELHPVAPPWLAGGLRGCPPVARARFAR